MEGLFKTSEGRPWVVIRSAIGGDTPEVEEFKTFVSSIFNYFYCKDTRGMEMTPQIRLGSLQIITCRCIVKNEAWGYDFFLF